MSPEDQNQPQKRRGRAWSTIRAVARGHYLPITAAMLAVAVCVTLAAPRALSNAAGTPAATGAAAAPAATSAPNDGSVTWHPTGGGQTQGTFCNITASSNITTSSSPAGATEMENLIEGLTWEQSPVIDDPNSVGINTNTQSIGIGPVGPISASGTPVIGQANVNCSILKADPAWSSGGVGVLAATYAWLAVSTIVTGAMLAYGATLPAGQATTLTSTTVLAAIAGCIAGAVATPILFSIGGGDQTALGTISDAVAGCLQPARQAQVSDTALGTWLSTVLSVVIPDARRIGGTGLTSAAASAGVDLTPMTTAMTDATTGLDTVAGLSPAP